MLQLHRSPREVLPRGIHAINGCRVSHWIRVHGGKRRQGPRAHRYTITVFDPNADVIPLCDTNHVADPVPVLDDDPHAFSEHVPLAHGQSEHITLTLPFIFALALALFHCDRRGVTLPHRLVVGHCDSVDVVNPNALGVEFSVS